MARKLLIDINVFFDVAGERDPHREASEKILTAIERKKALGFACATSFPTLYYLLERDIGPGDAREYLSVLFEILSIVPVDRRVLERAMELPCKDYEDAIQMAAAESCRADLIVTRDAQDYKKSPVKAITPAEYLATFG